MASPLAGVRVVELTTMITGPLAGMLLADLGASVIKVENPEGGDPFRYFRGGLYGGHFISYNRNKRSLTLDLRSPQGKEIFHELLETADVLIDNFRPGVLDRLGFTDAALRGLNPRLIHCSLTGFGRDGPYRDRPSYDAVAQSLAGVLNQFGSLVLLHSGTYSGVFTAGQLRALAYLPVDTQGISYDVYTVFFGFYALTIGYLVFRSTFLPRLVGVLMVIDGLAYLTDSFAAFLAPGFAAHLVPWILLPALFGEGSLCVALLVMGVNGERWKRVSVAAGMPALEGDRRWS